MEPRHDGSTLRPEKNHRTMKTHHSLLTSLACGVALAQPLRAETRVDDWTYIGGALNPNTYSALGDPGKYRPPFLFPDLVSVSGAKIGVTGTTSGGLGSSSFPDGYEFYYTFFSPSVTFTLQTSSVLAGASTITLGFNSGGGTTFTASSLTLNYNPAHSTAAASSFSATPGGTSEFGDLTNYAWTWDVSSFGASTELSTTWVASQQHTTFGDIQLTQFAVPEPSSFALLALGVGGGLWSLRVRCRKNSDVST